MKPRQLQAKGGQVYNHRLDPQTIFITRNLIEELGKTLQVKPSQTVLIRRALRYYGTFVLEELPRIQSIRQLETEREQLLRAAGR